MQQVPPFQLRLGVELQVRAVARIMMAPLPCSHEVTFWSPFGGRQKRIFHLPIQLFREIPSRLRAPRFIFDPALK